MNASTLLGPARGVRLAPAVLLVVLAHAAVVASLARRPVLPSGRGEVRVASVLTVRSLEARPTQAAPGPAPQAGAATPPTRPRVVTAVEPNAAPRLAPTPTPTGAKASRAAISRTTASGASVERPAVFRPAPRTAGPVAAPVPAPATTARRVPPGASQGVEGIPAGDLALDLRHAAETGAPPEPETALRAGPSMLSREALQALPLYAVRLPPSQQLHFRVRRGDAEGRGLLDWSQSEGRYRAALRLEGATLPTIEWTSQGEAEPDAGVSPQRMVTHRKGRPADAANFMLEQHKATFARARIEQPFVRGGQDRITWMLQLAGVLNARQAAGAAPGDAVVLYVVGPRGSAELWHFRVLGRESLDTEGGRVESLRLVREAERLYDTRYEIWLDPARDHLPLKWRQQQHGTGQPPLEWARIEG